MMIFETKLDNTFLNGHFLIDGFNPLPPHSFLKILKERQVLSLYWFAA